MNDYTAGKSWKIERQQKIIETGFRLFSERGIETVTLPEIAKESGVGHATLYRYFNTKLDLVIAISAWSWEKYITEYNASIPQEELLQMTGAEYLRFYLDSFIDLYRNHKDILSFNYDFNSYLRHEAGMKEQTQPFVRMVNNLKDSFHEMYLRGCKDGTLNTEFSEAAMFSGSFHIMLAAATRYAIGLVYIPEGSGDPEGELIMLEELLLSKYTGTVLT